MNDLPIAGGCYCGKIRYQIKKPPVRSLICYCANCRRAIGAQSVSWLTVESASFEFVQGTPSRYRTNTEAWRTFCSSCGTSLTYQNDRQEEKNLLDVTIGSLDQPERFPPKLRVFDDERISWEPILGGTNPM